jgi:hypothetical protein
MPSRVIPYVAALRAPAWIAIASIAGIAAAAWYMRRQASPRRGIDPARDRWDGEVGRDVDPNIAMAS